MGEAYEGDERRKKAEEDGRDKGEAVDEEGKVDEGEEEAKEVEEEG